MTNASSLNIDEIVLNTTHGAIKGRKCIGIYDDPYYSFERIPFAVPPLGKLRFKAPQPISSWHTLLDCTQKPEKPVQKNALTNEIEGVEDCLYLNVYVKELNTAEPLPLMVFLHGGAFEKGDASRDLHGPDYFMKKNVILVTIAYRLGPLGFLSLDDPALNIPGNAGLKDQLLGLKWINQNASNFNGDPNNITLFGESAGSAAVHYLMLSPNAKGLFHKAILMSGNVLCPWALSTLENIPKRLAQANGYDGPNADSDVLKFLQNVDAAELVRPYFLTKPENMDDSLFAFGPVVEPYESENCIISQDPAKLMATAWGNAIPVMLGGTSFEGLLMFPRAHMAPFLINELKDNAEHMLPLELKRTYELNRQKLLGALIGKTHFGDKEISMTNVMNYCNYVSYKIFWLPIYQTIDARLRHSSAPTFLYRFDFDSPNFNHQRIKYCGKTVRGVAHVDDHSYIFYGAFSWKLSLQSPEFKTIERMIDIWTTFATNSNPNCSRTEGLKWTTLNDINSLKCLNISEEVTLIDLPEMEKLKVWQSLYIDNSD